MLMGLGSLVVFPAGGGGLGAFLGVGGDFGALVGFGVEELLVGGVDFGDMLFYNVGLNGFVGRFRIRNCGGGDEGDTESEGGDE